MNRKILILALSLIVITSIVAVASVKADPTNGQKVPVTQITGSPISTTPGTFWITNGNVTQRRDFEQVIGTTLIIDGEAPITGLSYNTLDATGLMVVQCGLVIGTQYGISHQ